MGERTRAQRKADRLDSAKRILRKRFRRYEGSAAVRLWGEHDTLISRGLAVASRCSPVDRWRTWVDADGRGWGLMRLTAAGRALLGGRHG